MPPNGIDAVPTEPEFRITIPASMFLDNRKDRARSRVKTYATNPYSEWFARVTTSSSVWNRYTANTGPKISVCAMRMSSVRPASTVGS
ncbi:hypothetical protein G6F50_018412 [Rhizopus delemar]|uniref:Uncharacterized protein n=1 Tax=Rhizopus delemar TaxID=936053 RepID=A0A9P6XMW8_9FUNG|nr:hypothetical protein G6F50_018412 [Rhizopus delemar]